MHKNLSIILKISAVLWVVWGVVHILSGVFVLNPLLQGDTATAVHLIAGKVELSSLQMQYPEAATAILKQHAWNLGWFGIVTLIGAIFVWRKNRNAIFFNAIVAGFADTGYFLFLDLGDFVLAPGPQMTYICASAIILSFYVYFKSDKLKVI